MIKESFQYTIQLQSMVLKPTCNKEAIFLINVNRQAIKHIIIWQGKSERSDWFFLGRSGFYHTDCFHGNGLSSVFFGFKSYPVLSNRRRRR